MKQDSSTKLWNQLGREWFELAQTGESRMHFIMPYMLERMGNVQDKAILDLGCGEGGYSRALAKSGANVVAVDCSECSIAYCTEQATIAGLPIGALPPE